MKYAVATYNTKTERYERQRTRLGKTGFTATQVAWIRARCKLLRLRPPVVHPIVPSYPHLVGDLDCNPDLLRRLDAVGRSLGATIRIRSGRRTMVEQQALWDQNMNPTTGRPKPGHALTARPNANAPHVRGVAADCGIDGINIGAYPGARAAMREHGLCLNVSSENWHVQVEGPGVGWENNG